MADYIPEPFYPAYERVKKILVKLIPLRSVKIRERAWVKALHHNRQAIWKYRAFSSCKDKVETVVLGSSHATLGFIPDSRSFNLSDIAFDLYFSFSVLKYWLDEMYSADAAPPKLRQVVLFYDVFSPRNKLNRSPDCFRLIPYLELYGFDLQPGDCMRQDNALRLPFDELRKIYRDRVKSYRPRVDERYRGAFYFDKRTTQTSEPAHVRARAEGHMKLNRGADTESKWVESIFGLCKSHGIGLCVVVPPVRLDYREALGADEDDIFSAIRDIVARNPEIEFRSYHSSNAFDATDFADADHLNRKGAEKLTAMIRRDFGIGQGVAPPPGRMGEFGNGDPG